MPGVPRELAEHKLNADPKVRPSSSCCGPSMKSAAEPSPRRCSVYSLQASSGQSSTPSGWQTQSWSEEKWDLEDVYRLHKPKQRLPEGAIRPPADRPNHRFHRGLGVTMLPRRLLWIQPYQNGR